jgi:hypothetical protein
MLALVVAARNFQHLPDGGSIALLSWRSLLSVIVF